MHRTGQSNNEISRFTGVFPGAQGNGEDMKPGFSVCMPTLPWIKVSGTHAASQP